jgi:hypothetical protein
VARTVKIVLTALAFSLGAVHSSLAEVPSLNQPAWEQLSPEQRSILQPLAGEWPSMESYRRKKWLGIAQRYSTMSPDEKARVDQRMKEWAKLTPEQRQQARASFKSLKQVPPEHKEDVKKKWEEYSQLPAEQREQLKVDAARKPPTKAPPLVPPTRPAQQPAATAPLVPLAASPKRYPDGVVPAPTSALTPAPSAVKPIPAEKP